MTRRPNNTRIVETGRLARGSSGQPVGWLQSLGDRADNIMAKILGVQEKLASPYVNGVPSSVGGSLTFKADLSRTYTVVQYPTDIFDTTPAYTTLTLNPIILAGETYRVPILFSPPGILRADYLVVGIEAGTPEFRGVNRPLITPLNDYLQADTSGGMLPVSPTGNALQYTWQQQVLGNFCTSQPYLPFLWNIVDAKSGRQYAPTWMPHNTLMNTRGNDRATTGLHNDSELFEFDASWDFERDAEVQFWFRPLMDLYQIAPADATLPFTGADDRNPPGATGRRQMQATVHVEFHGNRYYDPQGQDLLKEGAYVTDADEEVAGGFGGFGGMR